MTDKPRETVLENLAAASALGFLALLLAILSIVVDSRNAAAEKAALARQSATVAAVKRIADPDFARVYEVKDGQSDSFGVVFPGRSRDSSAVFAAIFSPKGELRELRIVGSCSSRLPDDPKDALAVFPGAEDTLDRAAKAAISAAAEAGS